jgi:hypothetical protein
MLLFCGRILCLAKIMPDKTRLSVDLMGFYMSIVSHDKPGEVSESLYACPRPSFY